MIVRNGKADRVQGSTGRRYWGSADAIGIELQLATGQFRMQYFSPNWKSSHSGNADFFALSIYKTRKDGLSPES